MKNYLISLIILISITSQKQLFGCSTFLLSSDNCMLVGHNLDEDHIVPGYLMVNKRGVLKSNIGWMEILKGKNENNKRIQWVSKYGSVTFNPGGGKDFPDGGMNEAGLVVCEMSLGETKYPKDSLLPKMFQMQWVQYLLDNFKSVKEVQNHINEFELSGFNWHFFIADKTGDKMIIEFLNHETIVHSGSKVEYPVLCNTKYSSELNHLKTFEGFGGENSIDLSNKSDKNRFVNATCMLENYSSVKSESPTNYGFDILETLNNSGITKWSIIYDLKNNQVQFKTAEANQIKHLDFDKLDFSCTSNFNVYNLDNQNVTGDISELLVDYDKKESIKCLKAMWKGALSKEPFLTRVLVRKWATKGMTDYSETTYCKTE